MELDVNQPPDIGTSGKMSLYRPQSGVKAFLPSLLPTDWSPWQHGESIRRQEVKVVFGTRQPEHWAAEGVGRAQRGLQQRLPGTGKLGGPGSFICFVQASPGAATLKRLWWL